MTTARVDANIPRQCLGSKILDLKHIFVDPQGIPPKQPDSLSEEAVRQRDVD